MLARIAILLVVSAPAWAQAPGSVPASGATGPRPPSPGASVVTPRGPAVVTGRLGSMAVTTLPGAGGAGLLTNNGNGTSTLTTPGGIPQTVPTPR